MSDKRAEKVREDLRSATWYLRSNESPKSAIECLIAAVASLNNSIPALAEPAGEEMEQLHQMGQRTIAERDALKLAKNDAFGMAISNFMRDALVALAGAVCTPEEGYLVDGGLRQLLRDIQELRKQREELLGLAVRVKEVFGPMYEQGQCGHAFELLYARAKKLTAALSREPSNES